MSIYTIRFGEIPTRRWSGKPIVVPSTVFDEVNSTRAAISKAEIARTGNQSLSKKEIAKITERVVGYMSGLAEKTGGRSFHIKEIDDLEGIFGSIAAELSRQYSLGYYPARPGKPGERRQIKVKVNRPDVAVRSRNEVVFGTVKRQN